MTVLRLGCVVEGEGDERALPLLIRRIAERIDPTLTVHVPRPVRIKRDRLDERFGELERGVKLAVQNVRAQGGILVVLDSDGEPPCQLGPSLLLRVQRARGDLPSGVVLAHHEYESWFLAAAESLRGKCELDSSLNPPPNPEQVSGAKEWLRKHMPSRRKYSETRDQPALTAAFDFDLARSRADSFDKCYREIERLLRALLPPPAPAS